MEGTHSCLLTQYTSFLFSRGDSFLEILKICMILINFSARTTHKWHANDLSASYNGWINKIYRVPKSSKINYGNESIFVLFGLMHTCEHTHISLLCCWILKRFLFLHQYHPKGLSISLFLQQFEFSSKTHCGSRQDRVTTALHKYSWHLPASARNITLYLQQEWQEELNSITENVRIKN